MQHLQHMQPKAFFVIATSQAFELVRVKQVYMEVLQMCAEFHEEYPESLQKCHAHYWSLPDKNGKQNSKDKIRELMYETIGQT